jgi:hypothetical protein
MCEYEEESRVFVTLKRKDLGVLKVASSMKVTKVDERSLGGNQGEREQKKTCFYG